MIKQANITNSTAMQKNSNSLASFNALYLHISEKVLTHTHIAPGVDTFTALSYARA